jgi:hypothetical protein
MAPAATASFDSKTVNVVSGTYKESESFVGTEWDSWKAGNYTHPHKSYGMLTQVVLTCFEDAQAVTWANSVANYLNGLCQSGTQSVCSIQFGASGAIHNLSGNVYIIKVETWYDEALAVRYFQVTFRLV